MAVTVSEVMDEVGIDAEWATPAQKCRAEAALLAAEAWLVSAAGYAIALDMPQGEALVRMYASEDFDTRSLTDDRLSKFAGNKAAAALGRLAFDSLTQIRLMCARLVADERWARAEARAMEAFRERTLPDPDEVGA